MNTHAARTHEDQRQSASGGGSRTHGDSGPVSQLVDNRPEAIAQRRLQEQANNRMALKQLKGMKEASANAMPAGQAAQLVLSDEEVREWSSQPADDYADLEEAERNQINAYKIQLAKDRAQQAKEKKKQEEWAAALKSKKVGTDCISWDYGGKRYHVNLRLGTYHVTLEESPKIHYFFQGFGEEIEDKQAPAKERGANGTVFSALPPNIQEFIKSNYRALIP